MASGSRSASIAAEATIAPATAARKRLGGFSVPRFYLGTHMPNWLALTATPLFLSNRRLAERRTFPRARGPWALDSGGFSELSLFGEWRTRPREYADHVGRYSEAIGAPEFCAVQDWMCEPFMLARTGLSVERHQTLTIDSLVTLSAMLPTAPWLPVIQGYAESDYLRHVDAYAARGLDLRTYPLVGVGSICRRQATTEASRIVARLANMGIRIHAFGVKKTGLPAMRGAITSADSMAWSIDARLLRRPAFAECTHSNCANCLPYAERWYRQVVSHVG